ncbi:MAG: hypothetical protein M3321_06515 [Actinomycetota bacterium]|nr:hypothetical protein [Actinomycetota bacterium]
MGAREDRIARNEALFRDVNERVRELAGSFAGTPAREPIAFVCECGSGDCAASVELTLEQYERVRGDAAQFVVVPGHASPHVEHVVERHERYEVVRKHPDEADIALDTDPRA